jgi:hypothetical protein
MSCLFLSLQLGFAEIRNLRIEVSEARLIKTENGHMLGPVMFTWHLRNG